MRQYEALKFACDNTLVIYVTGKCNFNCSFCQNNFFMPEVDNWTHESTEKLKEVLADIHFNKICLSGGEPTLNVDSFKEIISTIREVSPYSKIITHTNGSMLDDDLVKFCEDNEVYLNISVRLKGEKDLDNLIKHSKVKNRIVKLIKNIKNKAIAFVFNKGEEFASEAIQLHEMFDANVRLVSNNKEWNTYTDDEVTWMKSEWSKIKEYDPEAFDTWCLITQFSYKERSVSYFYQLKGNKLFKVHDYPYHENEQYIRQMDPTMKRKLDWTATKFVPDNLHKAILTNIESKNYMIMTGLDCNLRCKYCYEHSKEPTSTADIQKAKIFLDNVFERDFGSPNSNKFVHIVLDFIGGEPTLHPQFIEECIDYALTLFKKYHVFKMGATFSTNGTLFFTEGMKHLLDKYGYMLHIGFSIDGTKEVHDAARVDINGNGTYDRAVEGLRYIQKNYPYIPVSVKATFTHQTMYQYGDSIINLMQLGFKHIAANVVFEETFTDEDTEVLLPEFAKIVDYMVDNDLYKTVEFLQLDNFRVPPLSYTPINTYTKESNWCGAGTYINCLGTDGKVYPCMRFCTMAHPLDMGYIDVENKTIVRENQELFEDIKSQYKKWPEECLKCPILNHCSSCAALPYETFPNDKHAVEKYFNLKKRCGWANAIVSARVYLAERVRALMGYPPLMIYPEDEQ